ncbi:DNA ligase [Candidatus Xenohaliotis californiensis]|uniref:DNA ligase n=2 Tax=Candidatus Xenohaliotis californiensis TaxID=84677 RepID=A0ABP0EWS8_9RICK|nr:DNA ligase [Candidatus Xenohaliotis californiensis]
MINTDLLLQKLEKINAEITKHSNLYYNQSSPIISDAKYDKLCQARDKLEKKLSLNGSTVGAPPSDRFIKVPHTSPMLSLSNGFTIKDIENFITKIKKFLNLSEKSTIDFYCEQKIDGVSISLVYINSKLVNALTRGNGYIGEDILCNVSHMFPKYLQGSEKKPVKVEIRGEIYIDHNEFAKINAKNSNEFLNPRNAASGSIRHLDSNITKQRNLRYFAYTVGTCTGIKFNSQSEIIETLDKWGFTVNKTHFATNNINKMLEWYSKICTQRPHLNYDIDGIVYKVNSTSLQKRLGYANRYPRWAIAHKFPAQQMETTVKDITIQVGRTGVLTPIAELSPVNLSGVTIRRASLHNKDDITKKDIRINDIVTIVRAGDIIPQVLRANQDKRNSYSKPFEFPLNCPSCGTLTISDIKNVAVKCPNEFNCPAQIIGKLAHFTSREALNITGLGKKQIECLFSVGLIKNLTSIFTLQVEDMAKLPNWGKKSAENLVYEIEKKRTIELNCFIYALGIKFIGINTAKIFSQHLRNYQNFYLLLNNINNERITTTLNNIDGIGNKTIESLKSFTQIKENILLLNNLANILTIKHNQIKQTKSTISNKTIIFTGKLTSMSRAEAKSIAEKLGARVSSNIIHDTNYLVSNAINSSKIKKAQQLGIKIITEKDWLEIINNNHL